MAARYAGTRAAAVSATIAAAAVTAAAVRQLRWVVPAVASVAALAAAMASNFAATVANYSEEQAGAVRWKWQLNIRYSRCSSRFQSKAVL